MSVMPPKMSHGCGRGVFGLKDWDKPLRRPKVLIPERTPNKPASQAQNVTSPDALKSPEIKCGSKSKVVLFLDTLISIKGLGTIRAIFGLKKKLKVKDRNVA